MKPKIFIQTTLLAGLVTVGSVFSPKDSLSQVQNDTIWGFGTFKTSVEGENLPFTNIYCTPLQMEGDTVPDTTYEFITNSAGLSSFSLPVFIDLSTNVHNDKSLDDFIVAPNPSPDFNFVFNGQPSGDLRIFSLNGQLVKTAPLDYDVSSDVSRAYVDLSSQSTGVYIFSASTSDGLVSGKLLATNLSSKVGRQDLNSSLSVLKSSSEFEALYDVTVTHDGYYDYNEQVTISEGSNGLLSFTLSPIPEDTIWGTGQFRVEYLNGLGALPESHIYCTPLQMEGDTIPDTTYEFITATYGHADYSLPVSINLNQSSAKQGGLEQTLSSLKSTLTLEALYDITVTHEGYYDYNEQVTIHEGDNGFTLFILNALPPPPTPPQYRFIGGRVVDESHNPVQGATVWIKNQSNDSLLGNTLTQPDGNYFFGDSLLTGTHFYFGVGNIPGKFSFEGDPASVPDEIVEWDDTLKTDYYFTLLDKVRQVPGEALGVTVEPTAAQIKEFGSGVQFECAVRDTILWNQSTYSWTENQKEANRNTLNEGMVLFGLEGTFKEVDYELNNVDLQYYDPYTNAYVGQIGFNVAPGSDQTDPYVGEYQNSLGNMFDGTPAAEITVSGELTGFFKELFGQAFYINSISSRPSFMNWQATYPTYLDRAIVNLRVNYFKGAFDENNPTAYFDLTYLVDSLSPAKK